MNRITNLLLKNRDGINRICIATYKDFKLPPQFKIEGFPEINKPKQINKTPVYPNQMKAPKLPKCLAHMRGPELVHNQLIHKQYGIVALCGGSLKFGHYEMMRSALIRTLDFNKTFALWRIDSPSKPKTKHGQGKKMGGGRGPIDHYIMPIKRGRVILEIGGHIAYDEVFRLMQMISEGLPFPARPVTHEILLKMHAEDDEIKKVNINKLNWEWCVKNNILNCISYMGRYDLEWAHLGPQCR